MIRPSPGYGAMLAGEVWARIEAAMNFAEGDRVPIWDYIDNAAVVDHFRRDGDDLDAAMVRVYHGLGIDLCRGYGLAFKEEDEGTVTEQPELQTVVSGLSRWVSRYTIRSLDDLRRYQVQPLSDKDVADWVAEMHRRQQQFAPDTMFVPGHGCGFHATYGLMGQQLFSYAIYDAREEIDRIMGAINANAIRICQAAAREQLASLFFIGDDIAYKGGLLFSPKFLRETFLPCLRACCEPLNNAGIKVIYHSDGNLMEFVDDLLEAGIAGLNPIETIAGMDLGLLKKRYGKNLILVGGMDCSQLIPLGTVAEIETAVKEAMRVAAPGGGLFIGSTSEIVPATPLENVLAFYEACRTSGRYPIRV